MFGFIESPKRKKPNRENPKGPVFIIGLIMIWSFAALLLPFGIFLPISISALALVLLFLPLLFLGIYFLRTTGTSILFAVFLSLLSGGTSILFLGDYIGYLLGFTVRFDVRPEEVGNFSQSKYLYLKDYEWDETGQGEFLAPILIRNRFGNRIYGPVMKFRFQKIRSKTVEVLPRNVYALCYSTEDLECSFPPEAKGGLVILDPIWESDILQIPKGSVGLLWKDGGEAEFRKKGIFALASDLFLSILWMFIAFLPKWFQKLKN